MINSSVAVATNWCVCYYHWPLC